MTNGSLNIRKNRFGIGEKIEDSTIKDTKKVTEEKIVPSSPVVVMEQKDFTNLIEEQANNKVNKLQQNKVKGKEKIKDMSKTIRVEVGLHNKLKIKCVTEKISVEDYIESLIKKGLEEG